MALRAGTLLAFAVGLLATTPATATKTPALTSAPVEKRPQEPVVGLPCEGCEAVFDGMPAKLTATTTIAGPEEPGERMRIVGTVFAIDGHPAPGIIVYAYHTNARGIYPANERLRGHPGARHGLLRGWAQTDENGRYCFDTIRPAGYPDSDIAAHVHMHVIEVGRCTYYIDEILFEDDPRLTTERRRQLEQGRGGSGLVSPKRDASGNWTVTRDIRLGVEINGYPPGTPRPAGGKG